LFGGEKYVQNSLSESKENISKICHSHSVIECAR
jgi:hypothetical protein